MLLIATCKTCNGNYSVCKSTANNPYSYCNIECEKYQRREKKVILKLKSTFSLYFIWEEGIKKLKEDNKFFTFPIQEECRIIINVYRATFDTNIYIYIENFVNTLIDFRLLISHKLIKTVTCNTYKVEEKEEEKMEVVIYIEEKH